ncbi:sigma-70 family RNA polymerase sigma factor [Bacillus solitudinis]|uniref:sigma-70 family RNA polymerase sigma factor n=1 Tax=Bacillus solitudinis TaxID=2014074 RepID=UPI0012FE4EA9|nr:sigma-70 family RNA polymerase sigma factor [Bacillus solitudinis]
MSNHDFLENSKFKNKEQLIEELIELYAKQITNFSFTYVKDWGMAEDITQDVFIKVYDNLDTFRHEGSLKTWIYQIAANRSKDILRNSYFKTTIVSDLLESLMPKKGNTSPEDTVIQIAEDKTLAKNVLALPVKYREVIILYYYHEMSSTEISQFLQVNVGTVKSRLQRGRQRLKVTLTKESEYE